MDNWRAQLFFYLRKSFICWTKFKSFGQTEGWLSFFEGPISFCYKCCGENLKFWRGHGPQGATWLRPWPLKPIHNQLVCLSSTFFFKGPYISTGSSKVADMAKIGVLIVCLVLVAMDVVAGILSMEAEFAKNKVHDLSL